MHTLNHTHPRQLRLTIKKGQDDPQACAHTLRPRQTAHIRGTQLGDDPLQRVSTDLEQTILAIVEQVIKRLP